MSPTTCHQHWCSLIIFCNSNFISVSSDFIKRIKAAKIPVAVLAGVAGLLFFLFGVRELTKYLQQLGDIIKHQVMPLKILGSRTTLKEYSTMILTPRENWAKHIFLKITIFIGTFAVPILTLVHWPFEHFYGLAIRDSFIVFCFVLCMTDNVTQLDR